MGVAVGGLASLLHAGMGLTAQAPDTTRRDSAVVLPPVTIAATRSERELFALPLAVSRVKPHTWLGGYSLRVASTSPGFSTAAFETCHSLLTTSYGAASPASSSRFAFVW